MAFGKFKNIFGDKNEENIDDIEDEFYTITPEESFKKVGEGGSKMVLVEPRAYSESQQIADHLKARNAVLVNFQRVTSDQSKRIIDFLSGTLYAIGGDLQKVGGGIYLCTPKNVNVQGSITEENNKNRNDDTIDL